MPSKDALYVHVFTILHTFFEEKMPTISSFFWEESFLCLLVLYNKGAFLENLLAKPTNISKESTRILNKIKFRGSSGQPTHF